jgi:hypothetical protein
MATKDKKPRTRKSEAETQAISEPTVVPRHRLASAVGHPESLAQSGSVGTGLPDVIEHLGNQLKRPIIEVRSGYADIGLSRRPRLRARRPRWRPSAGPRGRLLHSGR